MKKQLLILSVGIATLLMACSPAQIASGNYSGTAYGDYTSGSSWGSSSCTVAVTEVNSGAVKVVFTPSGQSTWTIDAVTVTKLEVPGVGVQVTFSGTGNPSVSGYYTEVAGLKELSINADSTGGAYGSIDFDGTK